MTTIYTDGACSGNPGPGGWAWAIAPEGEVHGSGGAAHTTNQRMEMMAVLQALRSNPGQLTIVSDSTYVVNCFRDRWWVRWQANGWKNSKKEPVANTDIWKPLIELVQQRLPTFQWVKGHSGDFMNDFVDRLAVVAALGPFTEEVVPATVPEQDRLF
jgi:ribonuclease HI